MSNRRNWPNWVLRISAYVALSAMAAMTPWADLRRKTNGDLFTEKTILETVELFSLALPATLLLGIGLSRVAWRSVSFVMALLLSGGIVRELDYLLDRVFDGLWQMLASVLAATIAWLIWHDRDNFLRRLRQFSEAPDSA